MTPVVGLLLALNFAVYGLQYLAADKLFVHFALWPIGSYEFADHVFVGFEPWQLITTAFLHDPNNFGHIAFNMFALYQFGTAVERAVGSRRFAGLYTASVLSASLVQLLVVTATADQGAVPTVGASGGVFGVLLAFAFLFPHARLMLIFPPIPMKAWVLVMVYAGVELANGVFGTMQGVAHFAHLGGMLGAILMLFVWRRSIRRQPGP